MTAPSREAGRRTVAETWRQAVDRLGGRPAFLVQDRPQWREVSWEEAGRWVEDLAAGFLSLGLGRGDRVAILCRTRLEWILCDQALIAIGAVVVPTYPTSAASECAHVLSDSGARAAVCEDATQYGKLERARADLPALEHVVAVERFPGADASLDEIRDRGRRHLRDHPSAVREARSAIGEGDLLTVVYTSGTTGPPKGCMLTHRNYWTMVDMVARVPGLIEPGDRTVLHLPLAHVFARLIELMGPRTDLTIALCPETAALPGALRAVRPTIFASVPRVFEGVSRSILGRIEHARGARGRVGGGGG
jgi:long-chain acyl-CoA synthetase